MYQKDPQTLNTSDNDFSISANTTDYDRQSVLKSVGAIDEDDPARIARREIIQGKYPSHERIRTVRPSKRALSNVSPGLLMATDELLAPPRGSGRIFYTLKRALIGAPLANSQAEHERLPKFKALAVLSSDAISSVAYATETCMGILILAGLSSLHLVLPIGIAIVALLAIVAISYSQTIPAYPNGGGSYIVAKDNLGTNAGLVAAAALLIDYVLTVSVSVASGVQNLASLSFFHFLSSTSHLEAWVDVALVVVITIVNLRGVRESGSIFAIPTYFFIFSALLMIIIGFFEAFVIHHQPLIGTFHVINNQAVHATESVSLFLVLRAFASGCSAMTGVEAISNGVPAFKKPEARNARITLMWMAIILGTLFGGITLLTLSFGISPDPSGTQTVIAQLAERIFTGPLAFMFPLFQIGILLILTLAANTSYADFPRLASLLARDHFLPHQFAFRGDRLAFSIGIVVLAIMASVLLIVFDGSVDHLIDLYAVGVFMSFTLSQSGMVLHWWRLRAEKKNWLRSAIINGTGALTTALVALIIAITKFASGAWIVVVLIPLLVLMFIGINAHYRRVEQERTSNIPASPTDIKHLFIVPIAGMDRVSIQSLSYARSITDNVIAVHVAIDDSDEQHVREAWKRWRPNISADEKTELVIIESPYRSLGKPLLAYIDTIHELYPDYTLTVLLPEFVVGHIWEHILHNQTALALKAALLFRPGIIVTSMPQHLSSRI
ncbi:APC family permease [Dictyobacter arantiisoli]|uniref:Amino acid permease n=1 Tax=Dictyobacter arantiisoli TaxID=2014874 RepID=A0A5A5THJ4_9CHLR|nr:APC family permease [Dictyobacter arantiisoli]GCF11051.1 amino acid permease [Dictyobacter arantiisoli]